MTQQQLDRVVARRTGESVRFIHRRGFQLIVVPKTSAEQHPQLSIDSPPASAGPANRATARVAS